MKKSRVILDILMLICFIIQMGYQITGNSIHEILGVITFILFIIHNILNIKWYKAIPKGKYNFQRTFQTVINIALLIDVILIMASGMMMSMTVFKFLNLSNFASLGRKLHLVTTSWGFVLMSIHLGMHVNIMLSKLNAKVKKSSFEYVYLFLLVLFAGIGLYCFISSKMWEDMFLLTQFKFYGENETWISYYLKYIAILLFFSLATFGLFTLIRKNKIEKKGDIKNV